MAKLKDQQKRIRSAILVDQWDRQYSVVISRETGNTTGVPRPMFIAPLGFPPSPEFWAEDPDHPGRIEIKYRAWIAQLKEGEREFRSTLEKYARQMYGDKAGEAIANPPASLLALAGSLRFPSKIVLAAQQGNGWILGLRPFNPASAKDKKLKMILDQFHASRAEREYLDPEDDENFGDEDLAEPVSAGLEVPIKRKRGRPPKARDEAEGRNTADGLVTIS